MFMLDQPLLSRIPTYVYAPYARASRIRGHAANGDFWGHAVRRHASHEYVKVSKIWHGTCITLFRFNDLVLFEEHSSTQQGRWRKNDGTCPMPPQVSAHTAKAFCFIR